MMNRYGLAATLTTSGRNLVAAMVRQAVELAAAGTAAVELVSVDSAAAWLDSAGRMRAEAVVVVEARVVLELVWRVGLA